MTDLELFEKFLKQTKLKYEKEESKLLETEKEFSGIDVIIKDPFCGVASFSFATKTQKLQAIVFFEEFGDEGENNV